MREELRVFEALLVSDVKVDYIESSCPALYHKNVPFTMCALPGFSVVFHMMIGKRTCMYSIFWEVEVVL